MATRRVPFIGSLNGGPTSLSSAHSSALGATSSSHAHAAGVASFTDPLHTSASSLEVSLRYIRFLQPSSHVLQHLHGFYVGVLKMSVERQMELGPDRSRTVFAYPADKVGIRFEYERYGSKAAQMRQARGIVATTTGDDEVLPMSPTTSVSLLLYVDSAPAFVSRAREAGFVVWLDVQSIPLGEAEDPAPLIRTAVLLDPLGIKVRLMEGEAGLYPRASRAHGRLGYVSLAVQDYAALERSVKFYDAVFRPGQAIAAPTALPKRSTNSILAAHQEESSAARKSLDSSQSVAGSSKAPAAVHGFRLVDMERFVEEMLTYFWLANGPRRKHTAVCLTHQVVRKGVAKASGAGGAGGERSMDKTTGSWAPATSATAQPISADAAAEAAGATGVAAPAAASTNPTGSDGEDDEDEDDDDSMQSALGLIDRKLATLEPEDAPLFLGLSLACNDMEQAVSHLANTEVGRNAAAAAAAASVVAAAVAAANAGVSPTADLAATAASPSSSSAPGVLAGSRLEVQHIAGFPRFISFVDPCGIPLELSDGVQGAGALSASASASSYNAALHSANMQSMMGLAGGVGSATAAAMLMRSNMMRAQAGTAAMAAASAAAAAAAAKSASAANLSRSRAPLPLPPLSFTPSPSSTRAGSPTAAPDEWSDGEGGGARRGASAAAAGRRSRVRISASVGGGGDSDASVSDDGDDAPAAGLGSYVQAALHYSGGGSGAKPSRSRRNSGSGTGGGLSTPRRRVATASAASPNHARASPAGPLSATPSGSTSRSPSRPHSSHPSKSMSPAAPHAPTTPRSGRSRPNSSKVR